MATEPVTGLTYQEAGSRQTDALQNAELNYYGAWLNCVVLSIGAPTPPGAPANGDRYIVGAAATGEWAGHDDALAVYRGAWQFYPALEGVSVHNLDDGADWIKGASTWGLKATGGGGPPGVSIGIQYMADVSATADADPGAGLLRWNNATQASATVLFLDDAAAGGATLTGLWAGLVAGGFAYLQHATDPDIWSINLITTVTDASGYAKLAITRLAGDGSFAASDPMLVTLEQGAAAAPVSSVNGATGAVILDDGDVKSAVTALTSGTTVTVDCSLGRNFTLTLGHNVGTLTLSNLAGAGFVTEGEIEIKQPASGGPYTFALPASFKALGGSDTAIATAANAVTILSFKTFNNGTTYRYAMQESA